MQTNNVRNWQQQYETEERVQQEQQIFVKVKKVGWITKGEKVLLAIVCVLLICAAYYMISYSSATYTLNQDVQALEESIDQQVIVNDSLLYEVKELSKPERIIQIAKENGLKTQNTKVKHATTSNN